jgi:hypothetical protein
MNISLIRAALLGCAMLAGAPAWAAPEDYRFEAVGKPVKAGDATLVKLRLVHVRDGKPVPGAILIQPRLEMGMGQGSMVEPARVGAPQAEPGVYAIEAKPSMGGDWVLTVGAKVPGETGTVRGRIPLTLAQ